ncbi:RloB family protein [Schlesneria sp. DSM 10557]|uniref:RloB family protein n=1 Tax=Schlesneria sp. DSM 10557 TaxID=3044399 RepID=UPI0035A1CDA6
MSKPRKSKKPQSKAVLHLLDQMRRKRETRETAKRYLIVCEDNKSAPNYFEALKSFLNLSATSIRVVPSGGDSQPIQVVNKAIHIKGLSEAPESGTEPFEKAWCVIDGDFGKKVKEARKVAKSSHGIEIAVSTMCFEFWVLLHGREINTPTTCCDDTLKILKDKYIPNYSKGDFDFGEVVPNYQTACQRAKKLRKPGIARGELAEDQNPCSEIYLIIEEICDGISVNKTN